MLLIVEVLTSLLHLVLLEEVLVLQEEVVLIDLQLLVVLLQEQQVVAVLHLEARLQEVHLHLEEEIKHLIIIY